MSKRLHLFYSLMDSEELDTEPFRRLCQGGIPDFNNLRSVCWKLLLNVLPTNKLEWKKATQLNLNNYNSLRQDLYYNSELDLTLNSQIEIDLNRTQRQFSFFHNENCLNKNSNIPHAYIDDSFQNSSNTSGVTLNSYFSEHTLKNSSFMSSNKHLESIKRILYIYSKINISLGYVQGMNEIAAALYYVAYNKEQVTPLEHVHSSETSEEQIESDVFYMFHNLMSCLSKVYINATSPINREHEAINKNMIFVKFERILFTVEPEIHSFLKSMEIEVKYYAFRWLYLLGSQDFNLPELIQLWDFVLSYVTIEDRIQSNTQKMLLKPVDTMVMVSIAMLKLIKERLLEAKELSDCMMLLQNYPTDIEVFEICLCAIEVDSVWYTLNFVEGAQPDRQTTGSLIGNASGIKMKYNNLMGKLL